MNSSRNADKRVKMNSYVVDSSAILAYLNNENGADVAEDYFPLAVISSVNLAEALSKSIEAGHTLESAWESINFLNLTVIDFDDVQAGKTAELRPLTRHLGLSLGDRSCLALAILHGATVVTADRNWKSLSLCPIELIR